MTPQEIFDKALAGVINQGDLSVNQTGFCFYRSPEGLACGVGHLVDDETAKVWDNIQEEEGITSEIHMLPVSLVPEWMLPHMDLLRDIQKAHDDSGRIDDPAPRLLLFLNKMKAAAATHSLEVKMTERDIERVLA